MSETATRLFGACLSDVLARHNLSAAAVSRMLGHKSRTTLRRILQDQANAESMEKFLSDFLEARLIPLAPEEERELRLALDISRTGLSAYQAKSEIRKLLEPARGVQDAHIIRFAEPDTGKSHSADDLLAMFARAQRLHLLLLNSVPASFGNLLAGFLAGRSDIHSEIEHYLFLNDDTSHTARFIASAYPFIGLSNYCAHAIEKPPAGQPWANLMTFPLIAIAADLPDGQSAEYQLAFTGPEECELLILNPRAGLLSFWQNIIDQTHGASSRITYACPPIGKLPSDLVRRAEAYRALEANHAIYMIKPGLCTALIPPDILKSSAVNSLPSSDEALVDIAQLNVIHEKRFSNIFSKKRVTHILTPLSSIRTFIETGLLPEHPPVLRSFTPTERREILIHCRNQARDNPYFNIYFLKSELVDLNLEMTCFDPIGVLLHSNLNMPQPDTLVTLNEFTHLFSQFFRETLLTHYALTSSASVAVLSSLIDELPTPSSSI